MIQIDHSNPNDEIKPNNTLTIGEIIEKTDEKSKIFADIHFKIVSLIRAATGNEDFKKIREPLELLTEYDIYSGKRLIDFSNFEIYKNELSAGSIHDNYCQPLDFSYREIYKRAFIFLNQLELNKVKAAAVTGTHQIDIAYRNLLLKNNDLTLLNETYKAFYILNESAAYNALISHLKTRIPYEIKKHDSELGTARVNARHEKQATQEKPIIDEIIKLWDMECAKNPKRKLKQTDAVAHIYKVINMNKPIKTLYVTLKKNREEIGYEKVKSVISNHVKSKKQPKK